MKKSVWIVWMAVVAACLIGCGGKNAKDKQAPAVDTAETSSTEKDTDSTQNVAGMDNRLVSDEGEAWVIWSGGSHLWSFAGMRFNVNGNFSVIDADGYLDDWDNWVENPEYVDEWKVKTPGKWYTRGNRALMISINGRTTAIPYTVKTDGSDKRDMLEFDLENLYDDSLNVKDLGDYQFYFGFYYYNREKGLAIPSD
jgi:hypothetical protein